MWAPLAARFAGVPALPHKISLQVRKGDYLNHNGYLPIGCTRGRGLGSTGDWRRANLTGDCLFMERNGDYEDLFLVAACDEQIMANSTFSWWGAWLGNGLTVIPRAWDPSFESTALFTTARSIVLDVPRVAGTVA